MNHYSINGGIIMNNYKYKQLIIWLSIIVSGVILFIFCQNDDFLYKDTIARVETVKIGNSEQTTDEYSNKDETTQQTLKLKILNGRYKGKSYNIINTYRQ